MRLLIVFFVINLSVHCFGQTKRFDLRELISQPDYTNVNSTEDGVVVLRVTVDPSGNVLRSEVIASETTISNKEAIERICDILQREAKYKAVDQEENSIIRVKFVIRKNSV